MGPWDVQVTHHGGRALVPPAELWPPGHLEGEHTAGCWCLRSAHASARGRVLVPEVGLCWWALSLHRHAPQPPALSRCGAGTSLRPPLPAEGTREWLQPGFHVPPAIRCRPRLQHQHVGHAALPGQQGQGPRGYPEVPSGSPSLLSIPSQPSPVPSVPSWVLAEQHMLAPGVPHSPTLGSPWVSNPF